MGVVSISSPTDFSKIKAGQIPKSSFELGYDLNNNNLLSKMDSNLVLTVLEGTGGVTVIGNQTIEDNTSDEVIGTNIAVLYGEIGIATADTTLILISFPDLKTLFGNINVSAQPALTTLLFQNLKNIGAEIEDVNAINIASNPVLTGFSLPNLLTITADDGVFVLLVSGTNNALINLLFAKLTDIICTNSTGTLIISIQFQPVLKTIDFSALVNYNATGIADLEIEENPLLTAILIDNLVNIGFATGSGIAINNNAVLLTFSMAKVIKLGDIDILNNTLLDSLNLPKVVNAIGIVIENNKLTSIILTALVSSGITISTENLLTTLSLPAYVNDNGVSFVLDTLPLFTNLSVPLFETAFDLEIISCAVITTLSFPVLSQCQDEFIISGNSLLTAVNINNLVFVGSSGMQINLNPVLTTLTLNATLFSAVGGGLMFSLNGNAFTQATVDAILQQAVTGGQSGGTIDVSGGTNSTPSAGGLANKATLVGLGWTINNN